MLRNLFITAVLVLIVAVFLGLYYFVYAPRQQNYYNKASFRVLGEIAGNFEQRLKGYAFSYAAGAKDSSRKMPVPAPPALSASDLGFNREQVLASIHPSGQRAQREYRNIQPVIKDSARVMDSLLNISLAAYGEKFTAVMLLRVDSSKGKLTGQLISQPKSIPLAWQIDMDSLLKARSAFTFSSIRDVEVEAVPYKLFLYPFRIGGRLYLLGGFMNEHAYRVEAQIFPLDSLLFFGIVLLGILLSLPFLKIFLLGSQETISVRDVRLTIGMIYILPFFCTVLAASLFLYAFVDQQSTLMLRELHRQTQKNFYAELDSAIRQLRRYDSLSRDSLPGYRQQMAHLLSRENESGRQKLRFIDVYFHPTLYKNFESVYWINPKGDDIAKWNLINKEAVFFNKADRQYFKDIRAHAGLRLPAGYVQDSFALEPLLSRRTGDYTVSLVIGSQTVFGQDTACAVGLNGKPYSVYNPVLPTGYQFCLINDKGDVLYHSQPERSLMENIFEETNDPDALRIAVSHKDSLFLSKVELFGKSVKLMGVPMDGLPYFMVTYCERRPLNLFLFHAITFTVLCEASLLLILTLLTLFFYYSGKRFSPLYISAHPLGFVQPTPLKKNYYRSLLVYQLLIAGLLGFCSLLFRGEQWLYFILNAAILLPLFTVCGYYLVRIVENKRAFVEQAAPETRFQAIRQLFAAPGFGSMLLRILLPYLVVLTGYHLLRLNLSNPDTASLRWPVSCLLFGFEILCPVLALWIAFFPFRFQKPEKPEGAEPEPKHGPGPKAQTQSLSYLHYFVLSILFSTVLTSVLPTLGFLFYGAGQEKNLQLKAQQIHLCQNIQNRRKYVNEVVGQTRLGSSNAFSAFAPMDQTYLDSLKFGQEKGVYLGNSRLRMDPNWLNSGEMSFPGGRFYKLLSRYLFLPADHADYFDNARDNYYYFWTLSRQGNSDSLVFHFRNETDPVEPAHLQLVSPYHAPSVFSFFHYLRGVWLFCLGLAFQAAFYVLILALSRRLFLINYFESRIGNEPVAGFAEDLVPCLPLQEERAKQFWGSDCLSLKVINQKEQQYEAGSLEHAECILTMQNMLQPVYDRIWNDLSASEKFVLFDMAQDGFANYKSVDTLYSLYYKGLIRKEQHTLRLMNDSFRKYLNTKAGSQEVYDLKKKVSEGGRWANLRTVLLVVLFAIVVFLFIVQEDISKRVFAIVTSLGALIPVLLKLFDPGPGGSDKTDKK